METINSPLSNAQLELLKLFSRQMNDAELLELKTHLAQFYAKRAIDEADRLWDERGYTQQTMDDWMKEPT